jgi:hypothetical protein
LFPLHSVIFNNWVNVKLLNFASIMIYKDLNWMEVQFKKKNDWVFWNIIKSCRPVSHSCQCLTRSPVTGSILGKHKRDLITSIIVLFSDNKDLSILIKLGLVL